MVERLAGCLDQLSRCRYTVYLGILKGFYLELYNVLPFPFAERLELHLKLKIVAS